MKRGLKAMYTEMLLDAIINEKWCRNVKNNYGVLFDSDIIYFTSEHLTVGKFRYKLECTVNGLFKKYVTVYVYTGCSYNYADKTDTLTYNIFSPIYWRILQINRDYLDSKKISETNLYLDVYKEFKKTATERNIKQLEESLAKLDKAEKEQRAMLETLRKKEVASES